MRSLAASASSSSDYMLLAAMVGEISRWERGLCTLLLALDLYLLTVSCSGTGSLSLATWLESGLWETAGATRSLSTETSLCSSAKVAVMPRALAWKSFLLASL